MKKSFQSFLELSYKVLFKARTIESKGQFLI